MSARSGERSGSRNSSSGNDVRFLVAAIISFLLVLYAGIRLIPPVKRESSPESRTFTLELNVAPVEFTVKGPLNLNSATAEELEALPGIGSELARRIVSYREAYGPFEDVDDLLNVRGIGSAILERIRELITVEEPELGLPR